MKITEVPQDLKYYQGTSIRDINYAIDEQGQYHAVMSDGWDAKNDALDLAWDEVNQQCEEIRKRVLSGKSSPLEYHATKNLMDLDLLSAYTGFSKRTIRKHNNPKRFQALNETILGVYADVLRISIEDLKSVPS